MGQWHKVYVNRAHKGGVVIGYIYEEDSVAAFDRYQKMKGVKRDPGPCMFPNIEPLSEEEGKKLENRIIKEGRITMGVAKRSWYYPQIY